MIPDHEQSEDLWDGLARHGVNASSFDLRGQTQTSCPYCGASGRMKLSRSTYRARCEACHVDATLAQFVDQLDLQAEESPIPLGEVDLELETEQPVVQQKSKAEQAVEARIAVAERTEQLDRLKSERALEAARLRAEKQARKGRFGERFIMTLLAFVFAGAGLAAAILSGFANYQAFGAGVSDPMQARIWGWSGVIASVCSFGGFTFFWWHANAKRYQEAIRSAVFAFAGAATSIAGTAMYMDQNSGAQAAEQARTEKAIHVIEAEIADWTRQLDGIPPTTRTVEGLQDYLTGVEAAGRAHQKPYRDAQNELGLAKRRDRLEQMIAEARSDLRLRSEQTVAAPSTVIPPMFFAVMLEVFSSQGTSIAFVCLLLLYGRKTVSVPEASTSTGDVTLA